MMGRPHHEGGRLVKDSTQIRGIHQGMVLWAQNNKDQYPLPSVIDAHNDTVADQGAGIAPEMKEKVFSPFCTTKARGMGLGLPIVKRTVFDHNGRMDIDTSTHGTSVSIALPATSNGD